MMFVITNLILPEKKFFNAIIKAKVMDLINDVKGLNILSR